MVLRSETSTQKNELDTPTKATVEAPLTEMNLYTGGKAGIKRSSLIQINASAERYGRPPAGPWLDTPTTNVVATKIEVLGWWLFGRHLDPSGDLYLALPDNEVKDLRLRVPGVKHYGAWAEAKRHKFVHETACVALADRNRARTQLGAGEYVSCRFEPGNFPTNAVWTTTAGGLDTTVGNSVWYTAPSNAANATVTATVAGTAKFKIKFEVREPSGVDNAHTYKVYEYTNFFGQGVSGAGMYLRVYVAPTDVSFYRVECLEVEEDATDVTGYYTNNPPWTTTHLSHIGQGANDWLQINCDNSWEYNWTWTRDWDRAWWRNFDPSSPPYLSWAAGSFTWNIPGAWRIPGGPSYTNMFWDQEFMLEANGTMKIEKFGKTVTRHPSSP